MFALAALIAAVVLVVTMSPGVGTHGKAVTSRHGPARKVPPLWHVQAGDTMTEISNKTGVSVSAIESYNPDVDPQHLVPGQTLKLVARLPKPPPKPLGPQYWDVKSGDSFGLIAAKTGIDIVKLEALNPQLKPSALQPGDRVKLRP